MPALDPAFDYVVADALTFTNDFGSAPAPVPTRVSPTAVAGASPTEVVVTVPAHDPAALAAPELAYAFWLPYPVAVSPITPEWLFDDANAFPSAAAPIPIPDPQQDTTVTLSYEGPPIYGQRGCQVVYAFRKPAA